MTVLDVIYLMLSMAANRLKREGLRLWLYRCRWGRGAEPKWPGDAVHARQMREVEYPNGVLCREDLRGYIFRLALEWAAGEAERANNAFNGELKEEDGIVLAHQGTQLLTLAVPE